MNNTCAAENDAEEVEVLQVDFLHSKVVWPPWMVSYNIECALHCSALSSKNTCRCNSVACSAEQSDLEFGNWCRDQHLASSLDNNMAEEIGSNNMTPAVAMVSDAQGQGDLEPE